MKELDRSIEDVITERPPTEQKFLLGHKLHIHASVFNLQLGNDAPARITPTHIRLDPNRKSVEVKVQRCPPEQKKFRNAYFQKFHFFEDAEPNPNALGHAASYLDPEDNSKYNVTIELRPAMQQSLARRHFSILKQSWQIFRGRYDFNNEILQHLLKNLSDAAFLHTCGIVSLQGILTSKRVLHGLANAAAHFQAHVLLFLQSMQNAFRS